MATIPSPQQPTNWVNPHVNPAVSLPYINSADIQKLAAQEANIVRLASEILLSLKPLQESLLEEKVKEIRASCRQLTGLMQKLALKIAQASQKQKDELREAHKAWKQAVEEVERCQQDQASSSVTKEQQATQAQSTPLSAAITRMNVTAHQLNQCKRALLQPIPQNAAAFLKWNHAVYGMDHMLVDLQKPQVDLAGALNVCHDILLSRQPSSSPLSQEDKQLLTNAVETAFLIHEKISLALQGLELIEST